ncbi:MAG TPA: magnesium transporter CorA family protein [Candidatus Saccharimonadales bacterium]|nr:magnesium transporter CorA family protein [Candidatus Saccharimonadales bacterium]
MIKYFYKSLRDQAVNEIDQPKPGTWVHVEAPSEDELALLVDHFSLEEGFIQDALDEDEVPRLEREDDKTYIFVRYAYKTADGELDTAPLLVVTDSKMVLTLSPLPLPTAESLLKGRTPATTQRTKLILLMLSHISDEYDVFISQTSRKIKSVRTRLRNRGVTNQDLIDFATIEDELNEFHSSLQPTNAALRRLLAGRQLKLFEEDQDIVEDLLLNNEQSIEAIRGNLKSIANIREAYSAISANDLNRTLTILTVATVLIALPNVFFGMYGMNVHLPYQHSQHAFEVIVGFNLLLILVILWFVRKKRVI